MKDVVIKKTELLDILKKNLAMHKDLYDSAAAAFREKYMAELNKMLLKSAESNDFQMSVNLQKPENREDDYEVAIRMLEVECRDEVTLEEQEFAKYVLNKWHWIHTFYSSFSSNTGYSGISGYSGYSGTQYTPSDMRKYFTGA
jgi:hypothetical protein